MKTLRRFLAAVLISFATLAANAQPMSLVAMRANARFLTDRMALTLGLRPDLIDALYYINYDYICGVNDYLDEVALGLRYDDYMQVVYARDYALRRLLDERQWEILIATNYFYRPIAFSNHRWSFSIYAFDNRRTHFFFRAPRRINEYRGGDIFGGMPHPGDPRPGMMPGMHPGGLPGGHPGAMPGMDPAMRPNGNPGMHPGGNPAAGQGGNRGNSLGFHIEGMGNGRPATPNNPNTGNGNNPGTPAMPNMGNGTMPGMPATPNTGAHHNDAAGRGGIATPTTSGNRTAATSVNGGSRTSASGSTTTQRTSSSSRPTVGGASRSSSSAGSTAVRGGRR